MKTATPAASTPDRILASEFCRLARGVFPATPLDRIARMIREESLPDWSDVSLTADRLADRLPAGPEKLRMMEVQDWAATKAMEADAHTLANNRYITVDGAQTTWGEFLANNGASIDPDEIAEVLIRAGRMNYNAGAGGIIEIVLL